MKLIWAIMVSCVFATQAIAADVQQRNPGIEGTIGAQIDAFLEDDFATAFGYASSSIKGYEKGAPEKGYVLFETGYGPSGLPHIGTFGEVLRTTMIRRAFEVISDIPTKLICFSDDLDGMRKS